MSGTNTIGEKCQEIQGEKLQKFASKDQLNIHKNKKNTKMGQR